MDKFQVGISCYAKIIMNDLEALLYHQKSLVMGLLAIKGMLKFNLKSCTCNVFLNELYVNDLFAFYFHG